ncbi:MAG: response regulator transcription factor [Nitrospiraceae bacterium]
MKSEDNNLNVLERSDESSNDDFDSSIADLRGGPGILLLSTDTRLLHMNRKGWELIKQINESLHLKAGGLMPTAITQICSEIQKLMQSQVGSKDWEQLEVRRMTGSGKSSVLLRGFGLPSGGNFKHSRILIIMESLGRREKMTEQAKERFQLTNREQSVVQNLARGWTNKEIASALGITEPTVKAHIKHIMEKTKCTTRTGILAQILHA